MVLMVMGWFSLVGCEGDYIRWLVEVKRLLNVPEVGIADPLGNILHQTIGCPIGAVETAAHDFPVNLKVIDLAFKVVGIGLDFVPKCIQHLRLECLVECLPTREHRVASKVGVDEADLPTVPRAGEGVGPHRDATVIVEIQRQQQTRLLCLAELIAGMKVIWGAVGVLVAQAVATVETDHHSQTIAILTGIQRVSGTEDSDFGGDAHAKIIPSPFKVSRPRLTRLLISTYKNFRAKIT